MAYQEILSSEIEEGAPLDTTTLNKIKNNFDYLKATSGGSGGAPEWSNSLYNGAFEVFDQGVNVFKFPYDEETAIRTVVNVPAGFTQGVVPTINLSIYSPMADGTKDINLSLQIALIRNNDSIENPTALLTKNVTVDNSSVANAIQKVEIDLANSGGYIDTSLITEGDQLRLTLSRKSDTVTNNVFMVPALATLKFSE